ncbi:MAG: PD40 domain-containing protein [Elusimicrobia bacterium]|nr:PD40 domain-containing protein [Elusimicrobiota bacterium]
MDRTLIPFCKSPVRSGLFLILYSLTIASPLRAQTDVYIGLQALQEGAALNLGFPAFLPQRPAMLQDIEIAHAAQNVVRYDLLFSRYFRLLEEGPLVTPGRLTESLEIWKKHGAVALLFVQAADLDSHLTLDAKLYEAATGQVIFEKFYRFPKKSRRAACHTLSDDLVRHFTGETGIARTRIAFVHNASGAKELYLMDYDGENLARLTHDRSLHILPLWSLDAKALYYTTYRHGNPDLYRLDMESSQSAAVSTVQGLNLPGSLSPDGQEMAITLSRQRDTDIFLLNLKNKKLRPLTSHPGIDIAPSFSPNGGEIVFVSDRGGNPNLYVIDREGANLRRLTALNWADSPRWSPKGDWIAFAGRPGPREKMDIYRVDGTGTRMERLTLGEGYNENPSWSPDGRFLVFTSTRRGRREVFFMGMDGSFPQPLATLRGDSFSPAWSP